MGDQAAFLSAGGYHHHIGLNTWESKGGSPPPPGSTGLLPRRHPLPVPCCARQGAAPARRRRRPALGRIRPRGQRGDLPPRPGRERDRAVPRSSTRGLADGSRRQPRDGERASRPERPPGRSAVKRVAIVGTPGSGGSRRSRDSWERAPSLPVSPPRPARLPAGRGNGSRTSSGMRSPRSCSPASAGSWTARSRWRRPSRGRTRSCSSTSLARGRYLGSREAARARVPRPAGAGLRARLRGQARPGLLAAAQDDPSLSERPAARDRGRSRSIRQRRRDGGSWRVTFRDGDVYVKQGRFWYDEHDRVTHC